MTLGSYIINLFLMVMKFSTNYINPNSDYSYNNMIYKNPENYLGGIYFNSSCFSFDLICMI